MNQGERGIGAPIRRIEPDGFLQVRHGLAEFGWPPASHILPASQKRIVGGRYARCWLLQGNLFLGIQAKGQRIGDAERDLVLEGEHIGERAIEAVCPEVTATERVNELRVDAQLLPRTL